MARQTTTTADGAIVYDDELVSQIDDALFDDAFAAAATQPGRIGGGRGAIAEIERGGAHWILRHYYRGGFPSRVSLDKYVWPGLERTRSFREWSMLARLHADGLPVPRPVAARVKRAALIYSADLITERLPNVLPLSARLATASIDAGTWQRVGSMIARFHAAGVDHADLNAHNIQISPDDELYLLDFDRGRFRSSFGNWAQKNLKRLQRSLAKISAGGDIEFSDADWQALLRGYEPTAT